MNLKKIFHYYQGWGAGAEAAWKKNQEPKKFAGSSALREFKKHKEIVSYSLLGKIVSFYD